MRKIAASFLVAMFMIAGSAFAKYVTKPTMAKADTSMMKSNKGMKMKKSSNSMITKKSSKGMTMKKSSNSMMMKKSSKNMNMKKSSNGKMMKTSSKSMKMKKGMKSSKSDSSMMKSKTMN